MTATRLKGRHQKEQLPQQWTKSTKLAPTRRTPWTVVAYICSTKAKTDTLLLFLGREEAVLD